MDTEVFTSRSTLIRAAPTWSSFTAHLPESSTSRPISTSPKGEPVRLSR